MTTIRAIRLASVVTAINVLVASGFSIVGIIRPQYLLPAGSVPTQASLILALYAAARTIPLALFALWAIFKQSVPALLILGALAGAMQLLDAGVGLFERDLGKCAGPLFIAVLQFFVVYLLHRHSKCKPRSPGLREDVYTHLSNGANMAEYWHWASIAANQETYWKGVLSHDLEQNRAYAEVSRTADELQRVRTSPCGFEDSQRGRDPVEPGLR